MKTCIGINYTKFKIMVPSLEEEKGVITSEGGIEGTTFDP